MLFLLETLTPNDRMSIITFNNYATRLCELKAITDSNKPAFQNLIHNIFANGGTDINSGLSMALKIIRERKYRN